jgi:hypothetical protein
VRDVERSAADLRIVGEAEVSTDGEHRGYRRDEKDLEVETGVEIAEQQRSSHAS